MADEYPRVFADDRGLWREDRAGSPYGVEWDEITRVSAYRIDLMERISSVVELEHASGDVLEVHGDDAGSAEALQVMDERLGIDPAWVAQLETMGPEDDPLEVWERAA